jgi:hypothetical protein
MPIPRLGASLIVGARLPDSRIVSGTERSNMADEPELEPSATPVNPESGEFDSAAVERREMLRRFGKFAAFTAPAMTVLMASRQSEAGSFFRDKAHHGRNGGKGGSAGGGGGGCGFSC